MWEQIRSNRMRSIVLVALMAAFLIGIGWLLGYSIANSPVGGIVVALIVCVILNLVAYFQGDSIMLSVAGAHKIKREDHPRLFNIVEEMRIASALPAMPDIYIIDDPSLNAFATGRDINHASVAITSGLLEKLNRDELQGVIAHEIGHIKNRDVLLMALCSVLLGTIVILSYYGSRVMLFGGMSGGSRRSSNRDSNGGGGGAAIIMVVALLLAILAPIFAQLIYLAVSRRREYLADASSALYTRNPEGLASALEKLSASTTPVQKANQATAPMYIVNPFRARNVNPGDWTSTHPPIQERIRILRALAGNVSYTAYNDAYNTVKGTRGGVMSQQAAASVPGAAIVAAAKEGPVEPSSEKIDRARDVSNLMYKINDYTIIDCDCGTRLKVPPELRGQTVRCPHCGRLHQA
jgi:heat shock protein HtpX